MVPTSHSHSHSHSHSTFRPHTHTLTHDQPPTNTSHSRRPPLTNAQLEPRMVRGERPAQVGGDVQGMGMRGLGPWVPRGEGGASSTNTNTTTNTAVERARAGEFFTPLPTPGGSFLSHQHHSNPQSHTQLQPPPYPLPLPPMNAHVYAHPHAPHWNPEESRYPILPPPITTHPNYPSSLAVGVGVAVGAWGLSLPGKTGWAGFGSGAYAPGQGQGSHPAQQQQPTSQYDPLFGDYPFPSHSPHNQNHHHGHNHDQNHHHDHDHNHHHDQNETRSGTGGKRKRTSPLGFHAVPNASSSSSTGTGAGAGSSGHRLFEGDGDVSSSSLHVGGSGFGNGNSNGNNGNRDGNGNGNGNGNNNGRQVYQTQPSPSLFFRKRSNDHLPLPLPLPLATSTSASSIHHPRNSLYLPVQTGRTGSGSSTRSKWGLTAQGTNNASDADANDNDGNGNGNGNGNDASLREEGEEDELDGEADDPAGEGVGMGMGMGMGMGRDKEDIRKEKNRDKQRRLRMRRANQLQALETTVSQQENQIESLSRRVREMEARSGREDERVDALERALRELGPRGEETIECIRAKFGAREDGERGGRGLSRLRVETRGSSGSSVNPMEEDIGSKEKARMGDGSFGGPDQGRSGLRVEIPPPSPISIQSLLSPAAAGSSWKESSFQVGNERRPALAIEAKRFPGTPSNSIPFTPSFFPPASSSFAFPVDMNDLYPDGRTEDDDHKSVPIDNLDLHSLAALKMEDVDSLSPASALRVARFLIQHTQPVEAYTPRAACTIMSSRDVLQESMNAMKALKGLKNEDLLAHEAEPSSIPLISPPVWRQTYTPAQVYLLYRVLMSYCHPEGSKEYFDGKRMSEMTGERKELYNRWAAYQGRDKRVELVPAMLLRMRIIMRNELADNHDLDLTAFFSDSLHEAIIYGNAWSMYCWDLPACFWNRWVTVFPAGKDFCASLQAWRRKDGHQGARPFEIIMGTERHDARREGGLDMPPPNWETQFLPK